MDDVYSWDQALSQGLCSRSTTPRWARSTCPARRCASTTTPSPGGRSSHVAPPTLGQHNESIREWLESPGREPRLARLAPGVRRPGVVAVTPARGRPHPARALLSSRSAVPCGWSACARATAATPCRCSPSPAPTSQPCWSSSTPSSRRPPGARPASSACSRVEVRTADAGTTDVLRRRRPGRRAHGLRRLRQRHRRRRRPHGRHAPVRCSRRRGHVIWTRGHRVPQDPTEVDGDPSEMVRRLFRDAGFEEVAFVRPDDAGVPGRRRPLARPRSGVPPRRADVQLRLTLTRRCSHNADPGR